MDIKLHPMIQSYFDYCYGYLDRDIKKSMSSSSNEIYGELYYYSVVKLLKYLNLTEKAHFLDIGSGFGKIVFQIFLTTNVSSATGIEINNQRHSIACSAKKIMEDNLPEIFNKNRKLYLINNNFLNINLDNLNNITMIYICCAVFSFELLSDIGNKINSMRSVQTVVSFRKLPNLSNFKLTKKIFLHGSWDYAPCYLYRRN